MTANTCLVASLRSTPNQSPLPSTQHRLHPRLPVHHRNSKIIISNSSSNSNSNSNSNHRRRSVRAAHPALWQRHIDTAVHRQFQHLHSHLIPQQHLFPSVRACTTCAKDHLRRRRAHPRLHKMPIYTIKDSLHHIGPPNPLLRWAQTTATPSALIVETRSNLQIHVAHQHQRPCRPERCNHRNRLARHVLPRTKSTDAHRVQAFHRQDMAILLSMLPFTKLTTRLTRL